MRLARESAVLRRGVSPLAKVGLSYYICKAAANRLTNRHQSPSLLQPLHSPSRKTCTATQHLPSTQALARGARKSASAPQVGLRPAKGVGSRLVIPDGEPAPHHPVVVLLKEPTRTAPPLSFGDQKNRRVADQESRRSKAREESAIKNKTSGQRQLPPKPSGQSLAGGGRHGGVRT